MPRTTSRIRTLSIICTVIVAIWAPGGAMAERLPLRIYTSADGVATTAGFSLVRDARGFMWVCTRDGLVRFDGYRFINYKVGDANADPAVYGLFTNRYGDYWINLNRGTDYKFTALSDERTVMPLPSTADTRVPFPGEPTTGLTFPRFEDEDGVFWTTSSDGLYRINREGTEPERVSMELPGNPSGMLVVTEFRDAKAGEGFWIGTNWGLVRRFPDGRMAHAAIDPSGSSDMVRPFAEDGDGRIWISKPDGIVVVKTPPDNALEGNSRASISKGVIAGDGTAKMPDSPWQGVKFDLQEVFRNSQQEGPIPPERTRPIVAAIIVDSGRRVWISSTRGLAMFDGERFRHFTTKNGLAMDDVSAMAEGIDGSIWILSYGGLHRLNPDGLSTYDEHDGIKRERVLNIQEDQAGRLFTISGNFFVSSFDGQKFQTARPNIPEDETFTWQSMGGFLDSRGSLWVLTNKKLYRFDAAADVSTLHGRAPDAVFTEGNGLIGGNVLKVWEDSKGDLWFSCYFGTERRGLTRFERSTGQFTDFTTKDGLPAVPVATGFAEDTDGSLLFAFVEGGFARFRDGKFSVVQSDTAPTGGLTAMFRDSKNRIWAATNREGLMLIENSTSDNPSFRKFTTAEGLASNNIRCITEGTGEDIYVGTVRGVNRISPDTGRVVYFGPADGLATDFVNSIHRDKSGNIWIGTYNGLSRLTPRGESAAVPPGIMISGVQVGGEAYSVSPVGQSEVHLPDLEAGQRNIQIEFLSAGSNFSTPARYHYRLGSEGDWSNPSAEPAVSFANLPAGAFRFEVRAINEYGIVSNAPAFVQFTVLRPVWQRWWFLLLAALAIGGIAYAVYRSRLAQAVKLERIRTRIASDLHDDIGSSLSQIAILSEIARQKAGELGISEPLRKIAETSREMVDSMSDIVWAINPDKDTLGDLVSRMRRFAEETLDATDIAYRFEFAGSLEGVALGTDRRRDAYLIFKEAVNNLVKHSSARNARFTVASGAGRVTFTIEDDGVGYSEPGDLEQTFPGFGGNGLINMRRRAENRGGTFSFRSRPGEGSRVEFTLPTRAGVTAR